MDEPPHEQGEEPGRADQSQDKGEDAAGVPVVHFGHVNPKLHLPSGECAATALLPVPPNVSGRLADGWSEGLAPSS